MWFDCAERFKEIDNRPHFPFKREILNYLCWFWNEKNSIFYLFWDEKNSKGLMPIILIMKKIQKDSPYISYNKKTQEDSLIYFSFVLKWERFKSKEHENYMKSALNEKESFTYFFIQVDTKGALNEKPPSHICYLCWHESSSKWKRLLHIFFIHVGMKSLFHIFCIHVDMKRLLDIFFYSRCHEKARSYMFYLCWHEKTHSYIFYSCWHEQTPSYIFYLCWHGKSFFRVWSTSIWPVKKL